MNELTVIQPSELVRQSTDIAGLCKEIVLKCASNIQGKKYIRVEGWQAIAVAHGCTASARDVEKIEGGMRAIGEVRRMADGAVISQAEGFVGDDEKKWAEGAEYARRAMVQTRAISRACRSAFAHVVVLMDAGLSTTPAEEVPHGGFNDGHAVEQRQQSREDAASGVGTQQPRQDAATSAALFKGDWQEVEIPFGKKKGAKLGALTSRDLKWWQDNYQPKPYEKTGFISDKDLMFRAALDASIGKVPAAGTEEPDEIPGFEFNDKPMLKKLAGELEWNSITPERFMELAKREKWIPENAASFLSMTEETAGKFAADIDAIVAADKAKP